LWIYANAPQIGQRVTADYACLGVGCTGQLNVDRFGQTFKYVIVCDEVFDVVQELRASFPKPFSTFPNQNDHQFALAAICPGQRPLL